MVMCFSTGCAGINFLCYPGADCSIDCDNAQFESCPEVQAATTARNRRRFDEEQLFAGITAPSAVEFGLDNYNAVVMCVMVVTVLGAFLLWAKRTAKRKDYDQI